MFRYVVLFVLFLCHVEGNGIGAPETACNAMMPGHGVNAQTSIPPFRLVLSGSEKLTVTISSSVNFKGFLLKAKTEAGPVSEYIGTFNSPPARTRRACTYQGVTHTDSYEKVSDELSFTWIPPDDVCGNFVFVATIAKDFSTIWKNITSERINIKCPTTTTPKPSTTTTTTANQATTTTRPETTTIKPLTSTKLASTQVPYTTTKQETTSVKIDTTMKMTTRIQTSTIPSTISAADDMLKLDPNCDVTKGCLHDCENGKCNYIITWQNLPDIIEFDITAKLSGTGNQWIAIGLSADKLMGGDSVIACKVMNDMVSVTQLYNTVTYRQNIPIQNGNMGLTFVSASFRDNILNCRFQRLKVITGEPKLFNLTEPWHVLFGSGQLSSSGMLMKHSTNPIASATKADFLSIKSVRGEKIVYTMVKVHATLMLVAWMLFASIGIVTARYFKDMWPNSKLCGVKVWFTIHRTCMVLVFLCTVAAFVVIFVEIGGLSQINPPDGLQFTKTHPILGIIVTALTLINPIMALFRPGPDAKRRPIFNGLHWLVGTGAFILAIVTIVFGLYLDKAGMPQIAVYITTGFGGVFVLIEIILEILTCLSKRTSVANSYDMSSVGNKPSRVEEFSMISHIKRLILFFHVLSMVGFSTVLIYLVWTN